MSPFDLWDEFIRQYKVLDRELQQFQNAVQELGSSVDLVISTRSMRDQAAMISWILEDNASRLFSQDASQFQPSSGGFRGNASTGPTQVLRLHGSQKPTAETLHTELKVMADKIDFLKMAILAFPDFNIDDDNWPLGQITEDFLYWSDCLSSHLGMFFIISPVASASEVAVLMIVLALAESHRTKAAQFYIQGLSKEIGNHFQEISGRLVSFNHRVPAVLRSQRRHISNLQNLSTMATFFSAVTATMLQFSIPSGGSGGLEDAVNAFWFGSLVLSVASALNSFLAYTRRTAMYSPKPRLNAISWRWIRLSPAIFLTLSVISFLAGLGCFAVVSQARGTQIVVFICELLSISTLTALLLLSIEDKWRYSQLRHYLKSATGKSRGSEVINGGPPRTAYRVSTSTPNPSIEEHLPTYRLSSSNVTRRLHTLTLSDNDLKQTIPHNFLEEPGHEGHPGSISSLARRTRQRPLRRLVGKMIGIKRVLQASNDAQMAVKLTSQLKLVAFTGVQIRLKGEQLVGSPAFSPDGNTLAVAGRTHTLRCDVTLPESKQIVSRESYMGSGQRQVAWSCSGSYLLTWTNQSPFIDVWTEDDASSSKIRRPRGIGLLMGIQHPKYPKETETDHTKSKFLVVEGKGMNKLTLVDVQGNEYASGSHSFTNIRIDHADVSCWRPDIRGWFVALAITIIRSPHGLKPVYAIPMRKLKVFDLSNPDVEFEIPIWHEVQDVKFSPNGRSLALNYRDNPPQIWSIKRDSNEMISLTLLRQLLAQSPLTMFRGKLSWLGSGHFLLAVTIAGEIYFWRRDKDVAVHVVRAADNDEDEAVEVACKTVGNHDFTFAVRSQDGVVRIWKAYETQQAQFDTS
ncbi:hypothetical protein BU17DRAFT_84682 [Hysterangium stoloniferum]|nr:hypothetical protein BU17DRAFT_84682 [Hysterangium stoloniferum]